MKPELIVTVLCLVKEVERIKNEIVKKPLQRIEVTCICQKV